MKIAIVFFLFNSIEDITHFMHLFKSLILFENLIYSISVTLFLNLNLIYSAKY